MSTPIFVLGCHRSGTSALSGLLKTACGVSMGELMPPTDDNPLGYFEAQGVADAHRDLLRQLERDWTCPPSTIDPGALDLSGLEEQLKIHQGLDDPWAMKDPTSMFLLPAWAQLGLDKVRLVAVARPPADTIKSIVERDGIREDRAEAIVDTYLRRLAEIAEQVALPVIRFPGDKQEPFTVQARELADRLGLGWDDDAATAFFRDGLVHQRSDGADTSPTYDHLLELATLPDAVPTTDLTTLQLTSEPAWPLDTHLGVQHTVQRNQLWALARFESFPQPEVVELLLEGARLGGRRPRRLDLHQLELPTPESAGVALLDSGRRPHGVVAHGLLAGRPTSDVEFILRSIHLGTHPLAELVIDVPDPTGDALAGARPTPVDHPTPGEVEAIAATCGWDLLQSTRISPGRRGLVLRKRVPTDHELVPMTTELVARAHRLTTLDDRLRALETRVDEGDKGRRGAAREVSAARQRAQKAEQRAQEAEQQSRDAQQQTREAEQEREAARDDAADARQAATTAQERASTAEHDLERLRNRRSVRTAVAMARPFRPLFRAVRSWRR